MRRHPAGKGVGAPSASSPGAQLPPTPGKRRVSVATNETPETSVRRERRAPSDGSERACDGVYRVRTGDSLWEVAASMAPGASAADVQDLTEQIYRLNQGTIGSDPDLIQPGQSLTLPRDCQR